MTGDDHASGGTAGPLRRLQRRAARRAARSRTGNACAARPTSTRRTPSRDTAGARPTRPTGFEIALHVTHGLRRTGRRQARWRTSSASQLGHFAAAVPEPAAPVDATARTASPGVTRRREPKVEAAHGIRLDTNYYYWPGSWVHDRPGMFTGSGMPMRFADTDGTLIDVYQAATQMTDESGQTSPFTSTRCSTTRSAPQGYYGAFIANMHTDDASRPRRGRRSSPSAQARGVPVVSARADADLARRPQRLVVPAAFAGGDSGTSTSHRARGCARPAGDGAVDSGHGTVSVCHARRLLRAVHAPHDQGHRVRGLRRRRREPAPPPTPPSARRRARQAAARPPGTPPASGAAGGLTGGRRGPRAAVK